MFFFVTEQDLKNLETQANQSATAVQKIAVPYQIAARGWEKLQFHSYHPGSVAPGLSDGGG